MRKKNLLKKLAIGTAIIGTLLIGPATCKNLGKGANTKYVETENYELYSYQPLDTCKYTNPLKFFKKDTSIFSSDKFLFVKRRGEAKIGDTLRIYRLYNSKTSFPEAMSFKFIQDSSQVVSQEEFLKSVSENEDPFCFCKRRDDDGLITNGIMSIKEKEIIKDKKRKDPLMGYQQSIRFYHQVLWREKEFNNYKKFKEALDE